MHVCWYVYLHIRMYSYMRTCADLHTCVCVDVYADSCVCVCIYACVCVCVCVSLYVYPPAHPRSRRPCSRQFHRLFRFTCKRHRDSENTVNAATIVPINMCVQPCCYVSSPVRQAENFGRCCEFSVVTIGNALLLRFLIFP